MKTIAIIVLSVIVVALLEAAVYRASFDLMATHYQNEIDQNEQENIEHMRRLRGKQ